MSRPAPDPLELTRIPNEGVAEAAARAQLRPQAMALLRPGQSARQFVEALVAASMNPEAIRFLAFALPRREAVWWAALFVLWSGAGHLHPDDALRLRAAVRWVVEPSEANRQEAAALAGPSTPTAKLAQAVQRSGGSMLPPKYPARPPAPELTPRGVVLAITAASLQGDPKALPLRQRQAVALGMQVARGRYLWHAATSASLQTNRPAAGS
jgi:hypothetical protein